MILFGEGGGGWAEGVVVFVFKEKMRDLGIFGGGGGGGGVWGFGGQGLGFRRFRVQGP